MNQPGNEETKYPSASRVQPGETVRKVRQDRGLGVRELARRVGLNPSHLSKIERGLANPSVGTLWMISDELGIPIADLFSPGTSKVAASSDIQAEQSSSTPEKNHDLPLFALPPCVDPENRESIRMAGVEFQRLTPHDDAAIEFMEVRHEVGAGDSEAYHHRGREYGVCLQGRLQVEIGFKKHVLEPGWSIAFDSSNPHRVLNVGDEPAVAIWVVIGRNQPWSTPPVGGAGFEELGRR